MDRAALTTTLVDLLEKSTGDRPENLTEQTHLKDELKLDSIDMVSLVIEIQSHLSINIKAEELTSIVTVGDLLNFLETKLAPSKAAA